MVGRKLRAMTPAEAAELQRRLKDKEHRISLNDVHGSTQWVAHLKGRIPGAGEYYLPEPHAISTMPRAPRAVSTSASRSSPNCPDGPGPGKYLAETGKGIATGGRILPSSPPTKPARMGVVATMSSESVVYVADLHRECEPGPGHYHPQIQGERPRTVSIGLTERKTYVDDLVRSKKNIPGPGSFQLLDDERRKSCGGVISSANVPSALEIDIARARELPGPGDYGRIDPGVSTQRSATSIHSEPHRVQTQHSMSSSRSERSTRTDITPGPGAYDTERGDALKKKRAPAAHIAGRWDPPPDETDGTKFKREDPFADVKLVGKDLIAKFYMPVKLTAQYAFKNRFRGDRGIGRIEEVNNEEGTCLVKWIGQMQDHLPKLCKIGQDGQHWLQLADFDVEVGRNAEKKQFVDCKLAAVYAHQNGIWRVQEAGRRAKDPLPKVKPGSIVAEVRKKAVNDVRADLLKCIEFGHAPKGPSQPQEINVSFYSVRQQEEKQDLDPEKEKAKKDFELKYRVRRKLGAVKNQFHKRFELLKTGELLAQMQVEMFRMHNKINIGFDVWENIHEPKSELQKRVQAKLAAKLDRKLNEEFRERIQHKAVVTSSMLTRLNSMRRRASLTTSTRGAVGPPDSLAGLVSQPESPTGSPLPSPPRSPLRLQTVTSSRTLGLQQAEAVGNKALKRQLANMLRKRSHSMQNLVGEDQGKGKTGPLKSKQYITSIFRKKPMAAKEGSAEQSQMRTAASRLLQLGGTFKSIESLTSASQSRRSSVGRSPAGTNWSMLEEMTANIIREQRRNSREGDGLGAAPASSESKPSVSPAPASPRAPPAAAPGVASSGAGDSRGPSERSSAATVRSPYLSSPSAGLPAPAASFRIKSPRVAAAGGGPASPRSAGSVTLPSMPRGVSGRHPRSVPGLGRGGSRRGSNSKLAAQADAGMDEQAIKIWREVEQPDGSSDSESAPRALDSAGRGDVQAGTGSGSGPGSPQLSRRSSDSAPRSPLPTLGSIDETAGEAAVES